MERAVCGWPDARPRAGFGSSGTKNFQNREKERPSKVAIPEFSGLWELRGGGWGRSNWSHLKMAETAAGPKHTEENKPVVLSPVGFPEGRLWLSPALVRGRKKEPVSGPETLLSRPGGEKPARGKLPFSVLRGVVGPSAPGSQQDGGCRTLTAASLRPVCQLLCREARWSYGFSTLAVTEQAAWRPPLAWPRFGGRVFLPPYVLGNRS